MKWNQWIHSNNNQIFGIAKFGDVAGGNYSEFESDGTYHMVGDATVWDDVRVPLETARLAGANVPAYESFIDGTYAWNFDDGDEIFFSVQIPHSWRIGSNIVAHAHWCPESDVSPSDNVGLGLEYVWQGINGVFAATTTVTVDAPTGVNASFRHNYTEWAALDASGIAGVSSMLLCRFFRQAAAGGDNYADGIFVLEIDFHFEMDTLGSRTEDVK